MPFTRFGEAGYGVRRTGSFAGKSQSRPVGIVTRFGEAGYGVRRAGSFAGKTGTEPPPVVTTPPAVAPAPSGAGRVTGPHAPAFPRRAEYRSSFEALRRQLANEERQSQVEQLDELIQYLDGQAIEASSRAFEEDVQAIGNAAIAFQQGLETRAELERQIATIAKVIEQERRRADDEDAMAAILLVMLR